MAVTSAQQAMPPQHLWDPKAKSAHIKMALGKSVSDGDPLGHRGYVATLPTSGPLLILPPPLKLWVPPRREGLCSHLAHLWATSDSFPGYAAVGTSLGDKGYVGTLPTFGPPPILPPARKRWGLPRPQGLCRHLAHLWATSDSASPSEAMGTPQAGGVM